MHTGKQPSRPREVLTRLSDAGVRTPVLILSGYAGIEDKVRALASVRTTM